ncbi:hypothetical protein [Halomonas sp. NO4]|nr:hypothetical protein [Halomonas sp. NO4]
MRNIILATLIAMMLAGCSSLEPVGHDTAKWHGEQHLDIMKHPNGRRY